MAEAKFNKGDVVELKSGSPKMTVVEYYPAGLTSVVFYDNITNRIINQEFDKSAFKISED